MTSLWLFTSHTLAWFGLFFHSPLLFEGVILIYLANNNFFFPLISFTLSLSKQEYVNYVFLSTSKEIIWQISSTILGLFVFCFLIIRNAHHKIFSYQLHSFDNTTWDSSRSQHLTGHSNTYQSTQTIYFILITNSEFPVLYHKK